MFLTAWPSPRATAGGCSSCWGISSSWVLPGQRVIVEGVIIVVAVVLGFLGGDQVEPDPLPGLVAHLVVQFQFGQFQLGALARFLALARGLAGVFGVVGHGVLLRRFAPSGLRSCRPVVPRLTNRCGSRARARSSR